MRNMEDQIGALPHNWHLVDFLFAAFPPLPATASAAAIIMSSGAGDNYEAVDMEESSDESGSDNEAFATKQEYKAYKEQFKVSKVDSKVEWES